MKPTKAQLELIKFVETEIRKMIIAALEKERKRLYREGRKMFDMLRQNIQN